MCDVDSFNESELRSSPRLIKNGNVSYWSRNSKLKAIALQKADFKCEFDCNHQTFIRKSNERDYSEGHHLIPLQAQGDKRFKETNVNLDCVENIVSLCSNCHNRLHYGKDFVDILKKLYEDRKEKLENKGIFITFEKLLNYYK